ncbi:MAG: molybdopterin-guanine dinucleotide biosynthesis protein B [Candidatus Zixiibacteriota bacterium]|nr:MAG: molybdopterin-guanine dinucleotide biosynthesis protein B [candidate division Zixibacteria bacterium]
MPLWITVTGPKKAGKTSTIEALIPYLKDCGWRVATVKRAWRPHGFDTPGKDTWRHRQAGAARVAMIGPGTGAFFAYDADEARLEGQAREFLGDCDVVLEEGFRDSRFPTIIVEGDEPLGDCHGPVIVSFRPLARPGRNSAVPREVLEKVQRFIQDHQP